jgi:four helix bundle protein
MIRKEVKVMSASYQDLRVWQNAMDLVESVYSETQGFPKEELYGLTSQMRRAAVSIPSNIAEGKGHSTDRDRSLFFCHARGSLLELETQVLIAQRLKFLAAPRAEALLNRSAQLGRMLNSLIQSMRSPESTTRPATRDPRVSSGVSRPESAV